MTEHQFAARRTGAVLAEEATAWPLGKKTADAAANLQRRGEPNKWAPRVFEFVSSFRARVRKGHRRGFGLPLAGPIGKVAGHETPAANGGSDALLLLRCIGRPGLI
jgi:hypothetical protein